MKIFGCFFFSELGISWPASNHIVHNRRQGNRRLAWSSGPKIFEALHHRNRRQQGRRRRTSVAPPDIERRHRASNPRRQQRLASQLRRIRRRRAPFRRGGVETCVVLAAGKVGDDLRGSGHVGRPPSVTNERHRSPKSRPGVNVINLFFFFTTLEAE